MVYHLRGESFLKLRSKYKSKNSKFFLSIDKFRLGKNVTYPFQFQFCIRFRKIVKEPESVVEKCGAETRSLLYRASSRILVQSVTLFLK